MSERVEGIEELESKVERLEATIQGLTEELVEVHDRLETLEGEAAPSDQSDQSDQSARPEQDEAAQAGTDNSKRSETQKEDETGGDSEYSDDIIVA